MQMYTQEPHSLPFEVKLFLRCHICLRQLIARDMLIPYIAVDGLAIAIVVLKCDTHASKSWTNQAFEQNSIELAREYITNMAGGIWKMVLLCEYGSRWHVGTEVKDVDVQDKVIFIVSTNCLTGLYENTENAPTSIMIDKAANISSKVL